MKQLSKTQRILRLINTIQEAEVEAREHKLVGVVELLKIAKSICQRDLAEEIVKRHE